MCTLDHEETLEHLFLYCPFTNTCWLALNTQLFESFKQQLNVPFFMEIVILYCWSLWTVWNRLILDGIQPSLLAGSFVFFIFIYSG
ncbi:hypothetical protein BDA96_02G338400 [Sorghum bicolor]|uniref:Reverse transcriptase zinc-binding domain-containing protein n=2 Tax=Sorghum bicolor TaxID=4558 RepID=A0A1W0W6Q7_SORBI|nr:hypothetical protein BDA96_02G338400 [Sorghum bicolor]OQU90031.1 hypothetical protein SORBI_3002G322350 [Sorghum bicolor]